MRHVLWRQLSIKLGADKLMKAACAMPAYSSVVSKTDLDLVERQTLATEPNRLTRATLREAAVRLASDDPDLGLVLNRYGPPPLWARPARYDTLVRIILEQQVSLASGRSAFNRLTRCTDRITPAHVLRLGSDRLRNLGLTRQKSRYIFELAAAISDGSIDLDRVSRMGDDEAQETLMTVPGIGPWTANIYLLMALRRRDVWPLADLALRKALQDLCQLPNSPSDKGLQRFAEKWRPYRAVAARILWHYYLSSPRNCRH